jgi:hypothetical protein
VILSAKLVVTKKSSLTGDNNTVVDESIFVAEELPDLGLWEIERAAALDPATISAHFIICRRLYPKDYTRKIEMEGSLLRSVGPRCPIYTDDLFLHFKKIA